MKTIGLLGGMSWESTVTYYQIINQTIQAELGGLHSAKCLLYSVDFDQVEQCQAAGDWARSAEILIEGAQALWRGGADFLVICTNTMHKVAQEITQAVPLPLLHIAQATALELQAAGITRVGLLGTRYTMEQDFYKKVLLEGGIDVLIPSREEIPFVHDVIYQELCRGILSDVSRRGYLDIIQRLADAGAQGIILGCTEIGLLIHQSDTEIPIFDTTLIHARQAACLALAP